MNHKCSNESTIAIILPMYNAVKTIDRAISSIINQSFENWRLYIIDDCSLDGSFDYVLNRYNDKRITLLKNSSNHGVARTRNIGIQKSVEGIITFIDSDDEWLSDKLMIQLSHLNEKYDTVISNYVYVKDDGSHKDIVCKKNILSRSDFLKKKFRVCFSSVMIRRKKIVLFKNIGHEDFLYIFNNLNENSEMYVTSELLVKYYECGGSLSSNKLKAARWHYEILNFIFDSKLKVVYYFLFYIYNALKFKLMARSIG